MKFDIYNSTIAVLIDLWDNKKEMTSLMNILEYADIFKQSWAVWEYKSFYNSSDVNSDTVNRLDPYGKKLQDHASGARTHKIFKLNTSSNVWEQMSFGEFYSPKFDRRFIPGRFDSHGELGVSPTSSEISADGLTFVYMFLGGFAWSKYENNRWSEPYYYFFPVSNPPSSRDAPNWISLNNDKTNMASSDPNFLELPVEYRTNVTNIDQYYYPDVLQASEYTGQVHISGNGKYIVAHNMHVGTPYSEDTNSSGNDYQPGPWITLYKLENNTTSWIAGLENFGNNTFLTTHMPHIADHTIAMSHDGMKIIITRGGITSQYGIIDGQSNGNYGALVTLENTTQTSGITSSLSVSNITATNLNVTNDISCNNLLANGKIKFFQNNEQIASAADSNGVLTRLDNLDNNVITIPTTDSDGNALTANTTYEMTTGPAGSINNISFVKNRSAFATWKLDVEFTESSNDFQVITACNILQSENIDYANGIFTVTNPGVYHINFQAAFTTRGDQSYGTHSLGRAGERETFTRIVAGAFQVNGKSQIAIVEDFRANFANFAGNSCSGTFKLAQGDTITFQTRRSQIDSQAKMVTDSHGTIVRIG